jgi:hypothetical protein
MSDCPSREVLHCMKIELSFLTSDKNLKFNFFPDLRAERRGGFRRIRVVDVKGVLQLVGGCGDGGVGGAARD